MRIKRMGSWVLCLSLLLPVGWLQKVPVIATELPTVQEEQEPTREQQCQQPEATEISDTVADTEPQADITADAADLTTTETAEISDTVADTEPQVDITIDAVALATTETVEVSVNAGEQAEDLNTVRGQGITFRLFNYSTDINKAAGAAAWRTISPYFTFRNSQLESGTDASAVPIPAPEMNANHDQDGFTKSHATVERILDGGYPVLDLTRNADGSDRTDPGVDQSERSLRYLFSSGDHAVTAYTPVNTILRQNGSHYSYNSADHAVDYDLEANCFRLRSYTEKNSTTATYGAQYGDFLPFTYTGGIVQGSTENGVAYHVDTLDTDYWYGMTMQVDFFQSKDGILGDENMVFRFSGDDDVWVFVDDVLVLDLGGTHGTVNGSIDFATGEVLQYLSWDGANATDTERTNGSDTSFPTTIRACFDAAGRTPNGGWREDGLTFADFTKHTLKFYYLERGAAVANCSLDFRLPTLPDKSLTLTKDITADLTIRDYIEDSVDYQFRVMKADASGNGTDEPFITAGMVYTLLEDGVAVGAGTVGEDNTFFLKAGQSAQFTQMLQKGNGTTRYVVEEIIPKELTGQYDGVEYLVSGEGGYTITEDDPAVPFAAYQTSAISAEQTQTVTFRNVVNTGKLATLKITKQAASGTQIPEDLYFRMQVRLGDTLLPVGTPYKVAEERRTVDTAGVLLLRAGETAELEQGILSGTHCYITELSSSLDGYRAAYSGTVYPEGDITCTQDGASGVIPLSGTIHFTVVNADYDFSVQIPIHKTVLGWHRDDTFLFQTEQVEQSGDTWRVVETLPETAITVTEEGTVEALVTIGYRFQDEGVFCYRITEIPGAGGYLSDPSVFHVEVTVFDGAAEVTAIERNGSEEEAVSFVNRAVTALTVTKTVSGGIGSVSFPFAAEIYLDGEPFLFSDLPDGDNFSVDGNRITFSLSHAEQITFPWIPIGATAIVEEYEHDGFLVSTQLEDGTVQEISGAKREVFLSSDPKTIHFINRTGYRMPNTGGMGTGLYTVGGAVLCLSVILQYKGSSGGRRKERYPIVTTKQLRKGRNQ